MPARIRTHALLLGALAALSLLAGCTGKHGSTAGSGSTASPGATASVSTGLSEVTPSAGSAPPAATFPTGAEAYARAALGAWSSGDAARLAQLNDPADHVFTTLSGGDYNRNFGTLYRCEGVAGSTWCTFYNTVGDTLRLRLRNDLVGKAHAIVEGRFTPITFPTDYRAYAQETLDAWLGHNTAAVALLTGKAGESAFSGVPAGARNTAWTFDHTEGAAGHEYFLFRDAAGDRLIFGFTNPGVASPPANGHGLVREVIYTPHG
jgi:hypothetical protein